MIVIDIPMPRQCGECPCSYTVRSGPYEGCTICNALEYRRKSCGILEDLGEYVVSEMEWRRPDKCPIRISLIK